MEEEPNSLLIKCEVEITKYREHTVQDTHLHNFAEDVLDTLKPEKLRSKGNENPQNQDENYLKSDLSSQTWKLNQFSCFICNTMCLNMNELRQHEASSHNMLHCRSCDDGFADNYHLQKHFKTHESGQLFTCNICHKRYSQLATLAKHKIIHYSGNYCNVCERTFTNYHELWQHKKEYINLKPSMCSYCGKSFVLTSSLKLHMSKHKDKMNISCEVCNEIFVLESDFVKHRQKHANYVEFINHRKKQTDSTYRCLECDKSFSSVRKLQSHLRKHVSGQKYICDVCGENFIDKKQLSNHVSVIHDTGKVFQCKMCDQVFNEKSTYKEHSKLHLNELYSCRSCGKVFKSITLLNRHKSVHGPKQPRTTPCEVCGKLYPGLRLLKMHMKVHSTEKPFSCSECGKAFKTMSSLGIHRQGMHPTDKVFTCNICDKSFHWYASYKKHEAQHEGRKSFKCDVCGKSFSESRILLRHSRIHTGEKPYSCDLCTRKFRILSDLTIHQKIHKRGPIHSCTVCGKTFNSRWILNEHSYTHTVEKPHTCEICGKQFAWKRTLINHARVHSDLRPYSCDDCKQAFKSPRELEVHKTRIHLKLRPFSCEICGKSFNHPGTLKYHKMIHLDIKPHSCSVCGKKFVRKGALKRHLLTHTGEKPFSCKICNMAFDRLYEMKEHEERHTPEPVVKVTRYNYENPQHVPSKLQNNISIDDAAKSCYIDSTSLNRDSSNDADRNEGLVIDNHSKLLFDSNINYNKEEISQVTEELYSTVSKESLTSNDISGERFTSQKHLKTIHPEIDILKRDSINLFNRKNSFSIDKESVSPFEPINEGDTLYNGYSSESSVQTIQENFNSGIMLHRSVVNVSKHKSKLAAPKSKEVVSMSFVNIEELDVGTQVKPEVFCDPINVSNDFEDSKLNYHENKDGGFDFCVDLKQDDGDSDDLTISDLIKNIKRDLKEENVERKSETTNKLYDVKYGKESQNISKYLQDGDMKKSIPSKCNSLVANGQKQCCKTSGGLRKKCLNCPMKNCIGKQNMTQESQLFRQHIKYCTYSEHFTCDQCGESFNSKKILLNHIISHLKGVLKCSLQRQYSNDNNLKQLHMRDNCAAENEKYNLFRYKDSGLILENSPAIDRHVSKPKTKFICKFCDKFFTLRQKLTAHMRTHIGESPFICDVCGKSFAFESGLDLHTLSHSTKLYACNLCQKRFKNPLLLKQHQYCHFNVDQCNCSVCDKAFKTQQALKVHNLVHSQGLVNVGKEQETSKEGNLRFESMTKNISNLNREFICDSCGKNFDSKCDIIAHVRMHFKKRLVCLSGKEFGTVNKLKKHSKDEDCLENDVQEVIKKTLSLLKESESNRKIAPQNKKHKGFECRVCGAVFKDSSTLYYHKKKHSTNRHTCKFCNKTFMLLQTLKSHSRIHTGEKPFICDVCGKAFTFKSGLYIHSQYHSKDMVACGICEKKFKNKILLKRHMERHLEERKYMCDDCGKGFKTANTLKIHCRIHTGELLFKCIICSEAFKSESDLSKHNNIHFKLLHKCDICKKNYKSEYRLKIHKNFHRDFTSQLNNQDNETQNDKLAKFPTCEVCGKRFYRLQLMQKHMRVHSDERPFECLQCGKRYKEQSTLNLHIAGIHSGTKYKCEICHKMFNFLASFQKHKLLHSEKRPYSCNNCEKTFLDKYVLKRHIQAKHLGLKPYLCDQCGKSFSSQGDLNIHRKTHSGVCYSCEKCGKLLKSRFALKCHEQTHLNLKPFSCKYCDRSFNHSRSLTVHQRVHSDDRPFSCSYCEWAFKSRAELNTHIKRKHTKEKPYSCEECGKCFTKVSSLNDHKIRHRGVKDVPCSDCGKLFVSPRDMRKHWRLKHSVKKVFDCKKCSKSFEKSTLLRIHERCHE